MADRKEWVYWYSRDSFEGKLAATIKLWWIKPVRHREERGVTWRPAVLADSGYLGLYTLEDIRQWFGPICDSDIELICAIKWATIEETKRQ